MRFLNIVLLILCFSQLSLGQTNVIDQEARDQKELSPWLFGLNYRVLTDIADPIEPREFTNFASGYTGYRFNQQTLLFGTVAGAFSSFSGGQVDVGDNSTDLFFNDVDLTLNHNIKLDPKNILSFNLSNELPTSSDAKREGYQSISSLSGSYVHLMLKGKLIASGGLGLNHIWNTYETSPVTNQINKMGSLGVSGSLLYFFYRRFFLGGSLGTQYSNYTDSSSDQTYRNSLATGYRDGHWNLSLSYVNGTYLNDNEARLWYLDSYRQIYNLTVGYNF